MLVDLIIDYFHFPERELVFYVNKAPRITIRDILNEIAKVLNNEKKPPGNLTGRNLRLVEVSQHRIHQVVEDETSSEIIANNNTTTRKGLVYFLKFWNVENNVILLLVYRLLPSRRNP